MVPDVPDHVTVFQTPPGPSDTLSISTFRHLRPSQTPPDDAFVVLEEDNVLEDDNNGPDELPCTDPVFGPDHVLDEVEVAKELVCYPRWVIQSLKYSNITNTASSLLH
ncbi:hypothetical protein GOP47_0008094 [Adiantum capillus-veneris]|uniref:Uncharacterized protein n=1 Tax=Adiantum capillus-veneris TaxID=13818 RepID=A0A9D4ZHV2_ADICA|nr:hypothetical protein GOP47_0008094 [Adiantum capillus-veneris]